MGKHTLRAGFQIQQMIKTENAVFSYAPGAGSNPIYMFNTFGDFLLGNVATFSQANRDVVPDCTSSTARCICRTTSRSTVS